jgi:hypothetical protein
MLEQLTAAYCAPLDAEAQIHQPSEDRDTGQLDDLVAQSRDGVRQQCPRPDLDARFAEMDRCLETNRVAAKVEQEQQAARLPRERKSVAATRGDSRYRGALARYRRAIDDRRTASEDLNDAKTRQGMDCGRRTEDCSRLGTLSERVSRAESERKRAESELGAIAEAHGIDRRDGEQLGLW